MSTASHIVTLIQGLQDVSEFRQLHWTGTYTEYLDLVKQDPKVARKAYQRLYDMIVSHGKDEYTEFKKRITRYRFFDDPMEGGRDAVFGIDVHLMRLVSAFKSAAQGYGTDRRVLLLHGPVGSAKSTIARLLKKGIEAYSRTPEGALYTYEWRGLDGDTEWVPCPMHEDPLKLVPPEFRDRVGEQLSSPDFQVRIEGELDPVCRFYYREYMRRSDGDWTPLSS